MCPRKPRQSPVTTVDVKGGFWTALRGMKYINICIYVKKMNDKDNINYKLRICLRYTSNEGGGGESKGSKVS
jgi:hypothetical protein